MNDFLERLREKPESHKKSIALATSGTITGLIFVMWVTVLFPNQLERQGRSYADTEGAQDVANDVSTAAANAREQYEEVQRRLSGAQTAGVANSLGAPEPSTTTATGTEAAPAAGVDGL